jgi:hydroxybutyrate-dimer hydrolase
MTPTLPRLVPLLAAATLAAACASPVATTGTEAAPDWRATAHRDGDDLLTAGLGLDGLRTAQAPAVADPARPTAEELRRRAVWSNWRGITDVAPGGGLGDVYGRLDPVPGREFHALRTLPGADHPFRVMLQLPDAFDRDKRCLVVSAASGSRGIYGAISIAGGWGLPRGCAVAHTDKGAGTGWFDAASGQGVRLDGTPGSAGDGLEFAPEVATGAPRVLFRHAHSGDNPEADWGRHVRIAAEFALDVMNAELADDAPWTFDGLQVIALGVSNGGGAVLRAAELDGDWLDGVVAVSSNIHTPGARPLYESATDAALLSPCAYSAAAFDGEPLARPGGAVPPAWTQRCATLAAAGLLSAADAAGQADEALAGLQAGGWSDAALAAGTLSTSFDLWRAVAAAYAAAYSRTGAAAMPCGFDYAMLDAEGTPRPPAAEERALWWSDSAGVAPAAGVMLVDALARDAPATDPAFVGLQCLRALLDSDDTPAAALRAGIAATRASLPPSTLPILVLHGADDGLVPDAFTSTPYVAWLRQSQRPVRYWRIDHAQHFDTFLGLPPLASRYLPLMPYAWHAMDAMWEHVANGAALPDDADIRPQPRAVVDGTVEPLQRAHLRLP